MLFTQIEFFFFLAAVFAAVLLVRNHRAQKAILLVASYYFYAYWDWRFAGLLLACTAINYWLAGRMEGSSPARRKQLVTVALVYSLGVLGLFKYFNFFRRHITYITGGATAPELMFRNAFAGCEN